jgi:hypothetical protein
MGDMSMRMCLRCWCFSLHPEYAAEILVDLARAMTLGAARKELSHLRLLHSPKDELISLAAAAQTSFSMHISANCADFSLSLEHVLSSG